MRTARNPDSSRMFERKHWLTKGQVQGFFSRLAASRRSKAHREAVNEARTGRTGRARETSRPGRGGHPPWS